VANQDIPEVWHASPELGTGRVPQVPGPASPLIRQLDKMLETEQIRLRACRSARNERGVARSRGRIGAIRIARSAAGSANHDSSRLHQLPEELRMIAHSARRRGRFTLFSKRTTFTSHASALSRVAFICEQHIAHIKSIDSITATGSKSHKVSTAKAGSRHARPSAPSSAPSSAIPRPQLSPHHARSSSQKSR